MTASKNPVTRNPKGGVRMTPIDYFSAPYLNRKLIDAAIAHADALIKAQRPKRPLPDVNVAAIAMVAPAAAGQGAVTRLRRGPGVRQLHTLDLFVDQSHESNAS